MSGAEHVRYQGYHELAYTHPHRFEPEPNVLEAWGLRPDEVFIVARFVSWRALHDTHDHGVTDAVGLVRSLGRFGRVLITSEDPLPAELEPLRIEAEAHKIHHLLYFATLFIGESATMASESATLGTPAIFISTSTRGYTNEQGSKYGLVHTFSDPVLAQGQALAKAVEILSDPRTAATARCRRQKLLGENIDVTEYVVELAESYAPSRARQDRG